MWMRVLTRFRRIVLSSTSAACLALMALPASAMSLKDSVSVALDSNPEIGQAIQNREAIEFELRQARGLYLPRIDAEGSAGVRRLDSPTRRASRIDDDELYPAEIGATLTQKVFDGFAREAEVDRQASRVDSASFRVLERSEFIALQVAREYIETVLQREIVAVARQNVAFHSRLVSEIRAGSAGGTLTDADSQQANERLLAARARLTEATEELAAAEIRFNRLVGMPIGSVSKPASLVRFMPASLDAALGAARTTNPRIKIANADIDVAYSQVKDARSRYLPEANIEARARTGSDIDGVENRTSDLQARFVVKWNLFNGGIDRANEQEQIRRVSEERLRLHAAHREVEEAVRISWDRRLRQQNLLSILQPQYSSARQVVGSYREQFGVGRRSLLDLLDAQNTQFNANLLVLTARYAVLFAEYRLMAAMGKLLPTLGMSAPQQADAYAREAANVPETPPAETMIRYSPPRPDNGGGWFGKLY